MNQTKTNGSQKRGWKKLLCLLLVFALLLSVAPAFSLRAEAVEENNGVAARIQEAQRRFNLYNKKYFTKSGNPVNEERLHKTLQRDDFQRYFKEINYEYKAGVDYINATTCEAFTRFMFRFIFGKTLHVLKGGKIEIDETNAVKAVAEGTPKEAIPKAQIGDVLVFKSPSGDSKHSCIALGETTRDGFWSFDSNWDLHSQIHYGTRTYDNVNKCYGDDTRVTVYRALNYDEVNHTKIVVKTGDATNITNTSATISGSTNGFAEYWGFSIGLASSLMISSYQQTGNVVDVAKYTGNLAPGITYYYRMWAVFKGEKVYGETKSFKTTNAQPNVPTVKLGASDLAIGDPITASWGSVNNATNYIVRLYKPDGKVLKNAEVQGTTHSFEGVNAPGTYKVTVEAANSAGSKGESEPQSVTVHPDVRVQFLDADDTPLCPVQLVPYGGSATPPAAPSAVGRTFERWDGSYTNVKEDVTIRPVYKVTAYVVRFVDNSGNDICPPQEVEYGKAAVAPEYVPSQAGYVMLGWDKDFSCVTEDMIVTATVDWYNANYRVLAKVTSAKRVLDTSAGTQAGYDIDISLQNNYTATTQGRVVVALQTKEGKLLTTTESAAFSVQQGGTKAMEIFVPYENAASVVKVFVVSQFSDVVPIAAAVTAEIDQGQEWSDWSTQQPPASAYETESRTEYRYRTKETKTSTESSLSGWTLEGSDWVMTGSGTIDYVASWPSGFDKSSNLYKKYNNTPVTAYETATDKRETSTSTIGYMYYHWSYALSGTPKEANRKISDHYHQWISGCGYTDIFEAFVSDKALDWNSSAGAYKCTGHSDYSYWWLSWSETNNTQVPVKRTTYTDYQKQFVYSKWSEYSGWSTTPVSASENTEVETRTVYRFKTHEDLAEDTSGEQRTVTCIVGKEYAGREASLFVYKIDTASDYTNEYVGQNTVDASGNVSFSFKLREEPSAATGDFVVELGLEGTSAGRFLDPILAPAKYYTVKFYDIKGNVLSEQSVREGDSAELPAADALQVEGYRFLNWTESNRNIREDLNIYPNYERQVFTVVFVDWTARNVQMEKFFYGDELTLPTLGEPAEDETIYWDTEAGTPVTKDMIVSSVIEKREVTATIIGFGECGFDDFEQAILAWSEGGLRAAPKFDVLDVQRVQINTAVTLPEMEDNEDYIFLGWKILSTTGENIAYMEDSIIEENAILFPEYSFSSKVDQITANIESGEYADPQTVTLECKTEAATIYYTLDGSNPLNSSTAKEYTAPITVSSSCQLRSAAVASKQNNSDELVLMLAINSEGVTPYHLLTIINPCELGDTTYNALVRDGYSPSVADFAGFLSGYTLVGFFHDSSFSKPFLTGTETVTESMTLYLKIAPEVYKVTFLDDNGEVLKTEEVEYLQSATPPKAEKAGYVFVGWDTDDYMCVTEELTVTACYLAEAEYATVSLDKTELTLASGGEYKLEATLTPAELSYKEVIWSSSDPYVAVVSKDGTVTAFSAGQTTITVMVADSKATATCVVTVTASPSETVIPGDINGDGDIDTIDAIRLAKFLVELVELTDAQKLAADVNGDGDVTALDGIRLAKFLVGLVETLRPEPAKAAPSAAAK